MAALNPLPFEKPIFDLESQIEQLERQSPASDELKESIRQLRLELQRRTREIYDGLKAWEVGSVARHPNRPQTMDYVELIFDEFVELHGDRAFGDDRAILTGLARIADQKLMYIGQHKGRNLDELIDHY